MMQKGQAATVKAWDRAAMIGLRQAQPSRTQAAASIGDSRYQFPGQQRSQIVVSQADRCHLRGRAIYSVGEQAAVSNKVRCPIFCLRRREFIAGLGGAVTAWPLKTQAQQRALPVVGFVSVA
jgi:hypothetical protein